jgi:hypothetical protein
MASTWTIKDSNGELLSHYVCGSRVEVGRKLVPGRYDSFRLQVSSSYRELFDRAVSQVLQREGWTIVRTKTPR